MLSEIHLSQEAIRLLAAIVNFGVAIACVVYIRITARDMRWSRSNKQFVTRNPQPEMYWFKMVLALLATVFTLGLGVLLVFPPQSKALPVNIHLPTLDAGRRR